MHTVSRNAKVDFADEGVLTNFAWNLGILARVDSLR